MRRAGIPTLHEQTWAGSNLRGQVMQLPPNVAGEWSAQVVPHLHLLDVDEVFHQVRDPMATVGSLLTFGLFDRPHTFGDAGRNIVDWFAVGPDPVTSAVRYWTEWNVRCGQHATRRWRVEDVDADLLLDVGAWLGVAVNAPQDALDAVPTNTNRKGTPVKIGWDDLPDNADTQAAYKLAERYGYA